MTDLVQLQSILSETLSPDRERRTKAEADIRQAQTISGHSLLILKLIQNENNSTPPAIRQSAAIHLKNLFKKGWDENNDETAQPGTAMALTNDKPMIRQHILQVMIHSSSSSSSLQKILSEAIAIMAKVDYPQAWPGLLPELVQTLGSVQAQNNAQATQSILWTVDSIFKCFRYVQRSDELYEKLKYSLVNFQQPLLSLYQAMSTQVQQQQANPTPNKQVLEDALQALYIMTRIIYSLNYQDLPEFFEDHMALWFKVYFFLLEMKTPALLNDPDEHDEPSVLDRVQAAIVQVMDLYASKDEEPFGPYLPTCTRLVWNLLQQVCTEHAKHDALATSSILFLNSLMEKAYHRGLFEKKETLQQILESIILPNVSFREVDQERFEDDNPNGEYMILETQGDSKETSRRRCAQDLLQSMCRQFPQETVEMVSGHVGTLLANYNKAPDAEWAQKDAAIHLMMGIAVSRENTMGVSQVNPSVQVLEFFQTHIFPELQETTGRRPVLQATAMKFISTFRFQFSREQLAHLLPHVIAHLQSPTVVVHTFACYTLDRMLVTTQAMEGAGLRIPKLQPDDLSPVLESLLNGLFAIVEKSTANSSENEFAMKCVTRALTRASQNVVPVHEFVMQKLTTVLAVVARNPRQPQFNHYLFESMASLVRSVCSQDPSSVARTMEPLLFPPFHAILGNQVVEFQPYVFQVLAQLLEYRTGGVGEAYTSLFGPIMTISLWEDNGNVPALTRLLQAYIGKVDILPHLQPILGIYQKLMSIPKTEEYGYAVMRSLLAHLDYQHLDQHMKTIFMIMLTPLQHRETKRRLRFATNFFALFVGLKGPKAFVEVLDRVQAGLGMVLIQGLWVRRLTEIAPSTSLEVKEHVIAGTRLLGECLEDPASWLAVFMGFVTVLTSPILSAKHDDDTSNAGAPIAMVYDSTFSRLQCAARPEQDLFASCADPRHSFCSTLAQYWRSHPDILPRINEMLDATQAAGLQTAFREAGVALS